MIETYQKLQIWKVRLEKEYFKNSDSTFWSFMLTLSERETSNFWKVSRTIWKKYRTDLQKRENKPKTKFCEYDEN